MHFDSPHDVDSFASPLVTSSERCDVQLWAEADTESEALLRAGWLATLLEAPRYTLCFVLVHHFLLEPPLHTLYLRRHFILFT